MIKKLLTLILTFLLGTIICVPSVFALEEDDKKTIDNIINEQKNINLKIDELNKKIDNKNKINNYFLKNVNSDIKNIEKDQENLNEKIDTRIDENINDETRNLQEQVNNLNVLISEKERNLSREMLQYSEQSMQYSKYTTDNFLKFLAVIIAALTFIGLKNIRDIKKTTLIKAEQEVKNMITMKTKEINNRFNIITTEANKKFEDIYRKIKENKEMNDLWNMAIAEKDRTKKIEIYDKILKKDYNNHRTHTNKGISLFLLEDYERAIKSFDVAIKINKKDHVACFGKGMVFLKLKNNEEAIYWFDKTIKINPNDDDAYASKGDALVKLERYKEAKECINKAIKINPNNYEAILSNAHLYLKLGDYLKAIKAFKLAKIKERKNNEEYTEFGYAINLSYAYHKIGDFEKAYDIAHNALCEDVAYIELIVNKGLAAAALDKSEEARKLLATAREKDPKNDEVIYCQARMFSLLKEADKAISVLKEAISFDNKWIDKARRENDFKYISNLNKFKEIIKF